MVLSVPGCASQPAAGRMAVAATAPADAFLAGLARHCGQGFAGRIVADTPAPSGPDAFEGKALVMHVRGCDQPTRELRVPFHVGDDHSRTWVITRRARACASGTTIATATAAQTC